MVKSQVNLSKLAKELKKKLGFFANVKPYRNEGKLGLVIELGGLKLLAAIPEKRASEKALLDEVRRQLFCLRLWGSKEEEIKKLEAKL